ncbi:UvrD-helicase domain-containing protein [Rossellomorea marisflavi]|uniref:RNA polymerase recycling motor HelD n=1 Tax=Rossellomorea marisflavi TaxID=189381 RepID=UPI00203B29D1|nr:RNA polymerase recycling motor HelD [Rossellomorea marisflavi]MCM2604773.1 UvrD-helicase domain-containing protein [Rossellomorea marisflavi]
MNAEYRKEQRRVDHVLEEINGEIEKLKEETSRRKQEVIHTRKHFWDEVKVNTDSFDDYLETIIGLRQEAQALSSSQSSHRHASKRLSTLERMKKIPYFGRIDFTEDGNESEEKVYIGVSSLTDETGENFLIYDWRAPISSVYYDDQPGPAAYDTPGGVIKGELNGKWQYLIREGVLESLFDTSLTIGDEILQQVLGRGKDQKMHSIVATIQQDQNRIIRHDQGRLLIVHGAAGSGKTSAALQRIAYLLYKYRDRIDADQIVLFSPNSLFSRYVSNVLPELGEENMHQVTFQEYLDHRLGDSFAVEDAYEQLEFVLGGQGEPFYAERLSAIGHKASKAFIQSVLAYRSTLDTDGMTFKDIVFRGEPVVTAGEIRDRFYQTALDLKFSNRLEALQEWILKKLKEVTRRERRKPWVQDAMEMLSEHAYHNARTHLALRKGYEREEVGDYEVEPDQLARLIVQQKMKPVRTYVREFGFIDFVAIYKGLFDAIDKAEETHWKGIGALTAKAIDDGRLYHEDATPFLFLKELILGFQINSSVRHLVIDEAQDYSPFQFEFLKRMFPAARMTILGDFNQAIFSHASGQADFRMLTGLYGEGETDTISLKRSYRSTKPIIEFTRTLIPDGEAIIPFDRSGETPSLDRVSNRAGLHQAVRSKVDHYRESGHESIAIICKTARESAEAFSALSDLGDVTLLTKGTLEHDQGVVIVPAYLSKGIEFDAVIIYDASEDCYGTEDVRRLFYTACTRAMHELQVYTMGEPSPFMENAITEGLIRIGDSVR